MTLSITVSDLLRSSINRQMIDVRSPSEFAAGHIPGAINIPMDQIPVNLSAQHRVVTERQRACLKAG